MKICFVLDECIYRAAGVQYYIINLSDWLIKLGHEVIVLHSENSAVLKYDINSQIKIISIAKGTDLNFFSVNGGVSVFPGFANSRRIREILISEKVDVVHLNYPFSPFISKKVLHEINKLKDKNIINTKVVTTFHVYVEEFLLGRVTNRLLGIYMKNAVKYIDSFINTGPTTDFYGKKYLNVESSFIPIGLKKFDLKDKNKTNGKKLNILFLGRLQQRKGVLDFIEALHLIRDKTLLENVNIKIAGDGAQRQLAELKAKEYDLDIQFIGKVDIGKARLYMETNLAVFPTKYGETFGIVLIEAMNFGCSIIGYANEGYKGTMARFKDECLVEPGNVSELSLKIENFLSNRNTKIYELGEKLKEYFDSTFDMEIVGNKVLDIYKSSSN